MQKLERKQGHCFRPGRQRVPPGFSTLGLIAPIALLVIYVIFFACCIHFDFL